jgi:hypothetical protein
LEGDPEEYDGDVIYWFIHHTGLDLHCGFDRVEEDGKWSLGWSIHELMNMNYEDIRVQAIQCLCYFVSINPFASVDGQLQWTEELLAKKRKHAIAETLDCLNSNIFIVHIHELMDAPSQRPFTIFLNAIEAAMEIKTSVVDKPVNDITIVFFRISFQ